MQATPDDCKPDDVCRKVTGKCQKKSRVDRIKRHAIAADAVHDEDESNRRKRMTVMDREGSAPDRFDISRAVVIGRIKTFMVE